MFEFVAHPVIYTAGHFYDMIYKSANYNEPCPETGSR